MRERQARLGHVVEDDDFGLLLRYGADCIGAVGLRGAEDAPPLAAPVETAANPGRTVSGIQKKLLVVKDGDHFEPAGAVGPAPYIAKFNSPNLPTLVRNEHLSLRWAARVLGAGEVTRFDLGHVAILDEVALVVTRFDRGPQGQKLRLEDIAQILCKPRGRDYAGKYDGSYEEVAEVIRTHSVRPQIDLARYFRRLVAYIIVGNCDAHLKNFALLETLLGLRLSPAYDIVNTAIYDGYDQKLALALDGKKPSIDQVTRRDLEQFGERIGLPGRAVQVYLQELKRRCLAAAPLLAPAAADGPLDFLPRFEQIVSDGCRRLLEE